MQVYVLTKQISRNGTEFQARMKWNENDVGIWGNRCVVSIYRHPKTIVDSHLMVALCWKL